MKNWIYSHCTPIFQIFVTLSFFWLYLTEINLYLQRIWVPRYLAFDRGHVAHITYLLRGVTLEDDPDHLQKYFFLLSLKQMGRAASESVRTNNFFTMVISLLASPLRTLLSRPRCSLERKRKHERSRVSSRFLLLTSNFSLIPIHDDVWQYEMTLTTCTYFLNESQCGSKWSIKCWYTWSPAKPQMIVYSRGQEKISQMTNTRAGLLGASHQKKSQNKVHIFMTHRTHSI